MKLTFFRIWIAAITLMFGWAASPVEAAQITPQYDAKPEYQKYWTKNFKDQVGEACRFLGSYINDNQTITITITIDSAMSSDVLARANMSNDKAVGSTNTADKFIAQSGEVTFNPYFYDANAKEWKSNNIYLMVHEIIHCLGFSNTIKAFNKHISAGTFSGLKTKQLNNGNAPGLSSDKSHFVTGTKDPAGVIPRMMENGGHLLSMLDLAVLADIGYSIRPEVEDFYGSSHPLGFYLNGLYASVFGKNDDGTPYTEYGARMVVSGGIGGDIMSANNSTAERIILKGYEENDTLITGDRITIMEGDDMDSFANGTDYKDTYRIVTNFKHVIVGLGANDILQILPELVFTKQDLALRPVEDQILQITVEGTDNTIPTYMYGTSKKPYLPFKVTIGTLSIYICYPYDGNAVDPGAKKAMNALKNTLQGKVSFYLRKTTHIP